MLYTITINNLSNPTNTPIQIITKWPTWTFICIAWKILRTYKNIGKVDSLSGEAALPYDSITTLNGVPIIGILVDETPDDSDLAFSL